MSALRGNDLMNKRLFFIVIAGIFLPIPSQAEIIQLKSGKTMEGKIISRDKNGVQVEVNGIPITYWMDDVVSINGETVNSGTASQADIEIINPKDSITETTVPSSVSENPLTEQQKSKMKQYYEQGNQCLDNGQIDEAVEYYKKAYAISPNEYAVNMAIGTVEFQSGNLDEASIYLENAVQIEPKNLGSRIAAGVVNRELGNLDDAINHLKAAYEIDPSNSAAPWELAQAYLQQQDMQSAKTWLIKAKDIAESEGDTRIIQRAENLLSQLQ